MSFRSIRSTRASRLFTRTALSIALLSASPAFAAGNWLTVKDINLEISAGNALDFSDLYGPVDLTANNPATKRVKTTSDGKMTLDGVNQNRFMCAAINFAGPWGDYPDTATAEKIALQLRRHGYNLVRMHHTESALMEGVGASADNNLKFNEAERAGFYNFLRVLKANGIHWMLDMVTDDNAAWGGVGKNRSKNSDFRTKLWVHYDPATQTHWKDIVDGIYNKDYDGIGSAGTILKDPALASVTLVNELSLTYNIRKQPNKAVPDALKDEMIAWAKKRVPAVTLTRATISTVVDAKSPNSALLMEFLGYKEKQTATWMKTYVEARSGTDLLVSAYNNGKVIQTAAGRDSTDMVNLHAYHDADGRPSQSANNSSFSDGLDYMQIFASNRYRNKPFVVDEYDIPYWNKWRREAGISIPAYAALQEWDGLCRYSNPVTLKYEKVKGVLRSERIYPFSIGMDPVARAGETLAALLFRRGDVAPAKKSFTVNLPDSYLYFKSSGNQTFPSSLGRVAFISKMAVTRTGATIPAETASSFTATNKTITGAQLTLWQNNLSKLKTASPGNESYITGEVEHYVSDTGQLLTHIEEVPGMPPVYQMSVRTPRTEAHVFQASRLPTFKTGDHLIVDSTDTDALVSLSSIDKPKADGTGNALAQSKRMLLIVATDALNSDSVFDNEERSNLVEIGNLPVQIESVSIQLSMRLDPARTYKVYPLNLNGDRRTIASGYETVPVQRLGDGTGFGMRIDLAALSAPTTYFEVERQD